MINTRILMKINCILLFISITLAHLQFIEKHSGTHILITVDATGTETIGEFYGKVKNALVTQKQDERIFRLLYAGEYIDETLATTSLADKSISIIEECTIEIEFSSIMRLNTNDPDVQFWFDEEMDALNFSKMDPMKTVVNISDNVELEFLFRLKHRFDGRSECWIMENDAFHLALGRVSNDDPRLELRFRGDYINFDHLSIRTSVILPEHIRQSLTLETRADEDYYNDVHQSPSPWYHIYFRLTNTEKELIVMDEHGQVVANSSVIVGPVGKWRCPNMRCAIFTRVYQHLSYPILSYPYPMLSDSNHLLATFKKFRFKSFANPPTIVSSQQHTSMRMIVIVSCILALILGIRLLITCVCRKEIKLTKINNDEKV
eukprot:176923_1